jgi:hypothetical protein
MSNKFPVQISCGPVPHTNARVLGTVDIASDKPLHENAGLAHQLTIHLESILISRTPPLCSRKTSVMRFSGSAVRSHTITVESLDPDTIYPVWSNCRHKTLAWCPVRVIFSLGLKLRMLQTQMVLSREPVMIVSPSYSTQYTASLWPNSLNRAGVRSGSARRASMSRRVLYRNFQSSDSGASEADVSRRTSCRSLSRE